MSFRKFLVFGIGRLIPDRMWIQIKYYQWFRKLPNLKNPQTFNEKLNWLKLYDRRPEYTTMVDKYEAKKYISDRIGVQYVVPTIGGPWHSFDEIDFDILPEQFVLKTTHDCGGVLICKDKKSFDKVKAKKFLEEHLRNNYYLTCREWPYKNVLPRIFAESYMKDGENDFLPVYKIMCFNGEPKVIQSIQNDKQPNESIDYFDTDWNLLILKQNFPNSEAPLSKPVHLNEMLEIARVLAKDKYFLRVDLYVINDEISFSECTFYSDAGLAEFKPADWDEKLGRWIKLPENMGGYRVILNGMIIEIHISEKELTEFTMDENNRIISAIEKEQIDQLTDYKFFCFDGNVKALFIATDRADDKIETKFDFFDANYNHLALSQGHPNATEPPKKPAAFELMKRLASELSKGIPQLRVDFYEVGNRIYVGELTLFHFSGNVPFQPELWDYTFGSWIQLPNKE